MGPLKRKAAERHSYKWKKHKQESGRLRLDVRGLLITNSISGKYKEAMQEALTILRQHAEDHYPLPEDNVGGDVEELGVEDLLKRGKEELNKSFNRFIPGACISKGLNLLLFKNRLDVPSKYVQEIFHEINNKKTYSARYLSRIIPLDYMCYANYEELENTLMKVIAHEFKHSNANKIIQEKNRDCNDASSTANCLSSCPTGSSSSSLTGVPGEKVDNGGGIQGNSESSDLLDGSNEEGATGQGEGVTWAMEYKCSNSSAFDREMVLDMLCRLIGPEYRVDLKKPDKLIILYVVKEGSALSVPRDGRWILCKEEKDGKWFIHESNEWMYNPQESSYFHISTQTIVDGINTTEAHASEDKGCTKRKSSDLEQAHVDDGQEGSVNAEDDALSESSSVLMDFSKDLIAGTVSHKAQVEWKTECEDRYIKCDCMSIQYVTDSDALCYYSGVFDGHYGSACSEYVSKHLKNNILSVFRQSIRNIKSKRGKKRPKSSDNECVEVEALVQGCIKGFEMTDNNFITFSERNKIADGSTACVVLLYGPDPDGCLKLITANAGDSRAILCEYENDKFKARQLTIDHKPDIEAERERIIKAGGTVEYLQGAWRAVTNKKCDYGACALSTSRSFGDLFLKKPNPIVSSVPDINIYNIDFNTNLFIVLCTDGITDVLSNQEIVDIISGGIKKGLRPEESAEIVVKTAEIQGSYDDKTCTIIYFGWHHDIFDECIKKKEEVKSEPTVTEEEEEEEEDDDIFK